MSIEFDDILNFRDVGKTINAYTGRKLLREGVLFRSARPDDATSRDRSRLTDELGIKTVVDLRSKTEHLKQVQKKRETDRRTRRGLQSDAALAESLQIAGLQYHAVRVTGRRLERELVRQLSWWNFFKLIFFFMFGYRTEAIRIMSREVMIPLGLTGLSLVTLDTSKNEILEALNLLISPSKPRPALLHCTQGKDRTGMIIALILLALKVPTEAIQHDYMLSQAGLQPEREERVVEAEDIGLTSAWVDCEPELISRVVSHLQIRYGGISGYLDSIGFSVVDRRMLVEVYGA
ncbi:tyrosine/serine protein phosphatase [Xylariaceae sp. FL0255]|nr:tyrosine/serine protein phosphatase [Xylariaceae sp. FL0255]